MSFSPKKFREIVVQMLYSSELGQSAPEELKEFMMEQLEVTATQIGLAYERASLILAQSGPIDDKIATLSASYDLERIGKVERNILRQACFELQEKLLPPEVIIAEAIRLTRKFSTESSCAFVTALCNAYIGKSNDASLPSH